jgi:hypothetical protein
MSVAYVLLAYKLPHQLGRLVRALEPEHSPVLIHVDRRTDSDTYRSMREAVGTPPNVGWLPRHRCRWGGFGIVAATLDAIAAVVERPIACEHLVLMTAQDYPTKPAAHIRRFLHDQREASFLAWDRMPVPGWEDTDGGRERYERYWLHVAGRMVPVPGRRRRLPPGLVAHGGLGYWALSRAAVEHVHAAVRARPELVPFFRHTMIPDELFFHTLLLSSPLADTVRDDPLRWVDFPPGAPSPRVLTTADLPQIRALPANGLWARKFDETVDADVLDAVDALNASG